MRPSAADSLSAKKLTAALRGLQPNQGERARRNARQRVLARLAALRDFVDEAFPAKRRPTKRRRRTAERPRLLEVANDNHAAKLAKAGIRTLACTSSVTTVLVPRWAAELRDLQPTIAQLREAKRSLIARRALMAEARLRTARAAGDA